MPGFLDPRGIIQPVYTGPSAEQISQSIGAGADEEARLAQHGAELMKQGISVPRRGLLGRPGFDTSQFSSGAATPAVPADTSLPPDAAGPIATPASTPSRGAALGAAIQRNVASSPSSPATDTGSWQGALGTLPNAPAADGQGGLAANVPARGSGVQSSPGAWSGITPSGTASTFGGGVMAPGGGTVGALRRPVPGALITDPHLLNGGTPRVATVADAHAHDQAIQNLVQGAAQRAQTGMMAPTPGVPAAAPTAAPAAAAPTAAAAPQDTRAQGGLMANTTGGGEFDVPTMQAFMRQSGIPDVIRGAGGAAYVPGLELAPEAYKAMVASKVLADRLNFQRNTQQQNIGLRGEEMRKTTDVRYGDQYDNYLKERPDKLADYSSRKGVDYDNNLGLLAKRHGYRSDEIEQMADAHMRTGEALARFHNATPNPEQKQGAVKLALGNFVQAGGGDADKTADIYNSSPDKAELRSMGLTEDMVRGAADNFRNGKDYTSAVKLETAGMANPANVGEKVEALPGRTAPKAAAAAPAPPTDRPTPIPGESAAQYIKRFRTWESKKRPTATAAQ